MLIPRDFERLDLRQRFDIIIDDLIGRDESNRGERHVLPAMLNDDAVKIAQRIVDLFCQISDLSDFEDDDDLEEEDK